MMLNSGLDGIKNNLPVPGIDQCRYLRDDRRREGRGRHCQPARQSVRGHSEDESQPDCPGSPWGRISSRSMSKARRKSGMPSARGHRLGIGQLPEPILIKKQEGQQVGGGKRKRPFQGNGLLGQGREVCQLLFRLRAIPAKPRRPIPNSSEVEGSGMGLILICTISLPQVCVNCANSAVVPFHPMVVRSMVMESASKRCPSIDLAWLSPNAMDLPGSCQVQCGIHLGFKPGIFASSIDTFLNDAIDYIVLVNDTPEVFGYHSPFLSLGNRNPRPKNTLSQVLEFPGVLRNKSPRPLLC
jgi:hypothetical protein